MSKQQNTAQQAQAQDQTQTAQQRERISLDAFLSDLASPETGEVLCQGLALEYASFLPAREDGRKATMSGLLMGFVDPVTGNPCHFEGKNGELLPGGCPIRFFGEDAEVMTDLLGERPAGLSLGLELQPEASASVYRAEDGSVLFLVLGTKDVINAGWVRGQKVRVPGKLG